MAFSSGELMVAKTPPRTRQAAETSSNVPTGTSKKSALDPAAVKPEYPALQAQSADAMEATAEDAEGSHVEQS